MNHEYDENQGLISVLSERILNGLFKENPTFVLLLGMCPTLAVTTSAINGLGMGVTTMVVLALSNLMISALRKVIPDKIRIPAFIVIIASFVTIVELLLNAYIPSLYDALGLYIPLIVVNCIILGRAEAYAYSNPVLPSLFDGLGMGMGFTVALTIIGAFREILGSGAVFGYRIMPQGYVPVSIFVMAPGAFFVLAMLTALQNKIKEIGTKKGHDMSKIQSGCGGNCMECSKECKVSVTASDEETELLSEEESTDNKDENPVPVADESKDDQPVNTSDNAESKETTEKSSEPDSDTASVEEKKDNVVEKVDANSEDEEEMVLLDLSDYKKAIQKNTPSGRKPVRKKNSMAKAQAMLSKAEGTIKEESDD